MLKHEGCSTKEINDVLYPDKSHPLIDFIWHAKTLGIHPATLLVAAVALLVVIAIGILAMSYGDGFASLIGGKFGKLNYKILGDEKSYIGSSIMFIFTFIIMIIALLFYKINITYGISRFFNEG